MQLRQTDSKVRYKCREKKCQSIIKLSLWYDDIKLMTARPLIDTK